MAWTQADVDAIKSLMARGLRRGRMPNGEEIEFHAIADMRAMLSMMEAEVAGVNRSSPVIAYPTTSRGL